MSASSQVRFVTEIDPIDGAFSNDTEINLYRIVQESVNNAVRHAKATKVELTIERTAAGVRVAVRDDGIGIAAQAIGIARAASSVSIVTLKPFPSPPRTFSAGT